MGPQTQGRSDLRMLLVLGIVGTVAAHLNVQIPHTDMFVEGRWAFGFLGFAWLRRWSLAWVLCAWLSIPLVWLSDVSFVAGFAGNLAYAVPCLLVLRPGHALLVSQTRRTWSYGIGWCVLVMACYQTFNTPVTAGWTAMLGGSAPWPAIVAGWMRQPLLVESLLVGIVSASAAVVLRTTESIRRHQEEIAHQQSLINSLLDSIPDIVFFKDVDGVYLGCNPAFAEHLGRTRGEIVGKTDYDLYSREEADAFKSFDAQALAELQPRRNEESISYPDGRRRLLETLKAPYWGPGGKLLGIIGVCRDITERKQVEQRLASSEQKWRNILLTTPQIGVSLDTTGAITFANEHFLELTGWREEEVLGRDWFDLCIPEDIRPRVREVFQTVMRQGDTAGLSSYENEIVTRDGSRVSVSWSNAATRDSAGKIVEVTCLGVDLSERKRAEQIRERLMSAVEQAGEMMVITDPDDVIVYVNPAFERTTGYARNEAVGQSGPALLGLLDRNEGFAEILAGLRRGEPFEGRLEHRRKDGRSFVAEGSVYPVRDRAGRIVNYVAVLGDVTAQLALEEQYHQSQKMESIGRLAGGVAHDFNNMLGVILGHAELALEQLGPEHPLHADIEEIRRAAGRSADLTRQLLAFARKQTVAPCDLDLNATVAGTLSMLRRLIGEDIELVWAPDEAAGLVTMDPAQPGQILANLCVNARDAISGVGTITIETRRQSFDEAFCAEHPGFSPGDYAVLVVTDDGRGMDEQTREHLFEPFFTTKETGKGTGLGLATVYGIVKQNGGFLRVESEPERGTAFEIYLPRAMPRTGGGPPKAEPGEDPARGKETILLVEDEPAILALTRRMLEKLGYRVLVAESPRDAVSLAGAFGGAIDLLITDVIMPEMNGRDLAAILESGRPGLRSLFMSGYTADVIARHGVLEEGMHFIQKPFTVRDLSAKVKSALG